MGQRANLVVIRNGKREIYYSHWRANTLDRDLFWGPAAATAFAQRQRSEAEGAVLLDEVWAEGGAIIDHSSRTLLWYGGEDVRFDIPRRRLHLTMMRELWPEWSVQWASEGIADIAEYLGLELEDVLQDEGDPPTDASRILEPAEDPSWISTVVTSRRNNSCEFFAIDPSIVQTLALGSYLLERVHTASGPHALDWGARTAEFPTGGLHVDWSSHEVAYWFAVDAPAIKRRAQAYFPGWTVTCWNSQYEMHVASAPGLVLPTVDHRSLTTALVDYLLAKEPDNSLMIPEVVRAQGEKDAQINPFALRDDVLGISLEERVALLAKHIPGLVG